MKGRTRGQQTGSVERTDPERKGSAAPGPIHRGGVFGRLAPTPPTPGVLGPSWALLHRGHCASPMYP